MALPGPTKWGNIGGRYNVGGSVVQFDPTHFTAVVMNNLETRLKLCGELWVEMAKANFTFVYPPHSMPWDFPHHSGDKDSMVNAIDWTVFHRGDVLVMQAGIINDDLPGRLNLYPGYLETGTQFMAPRPWITITTDEVWNDWGTILTGMGS